LFILLFQSVDLDFLKHTQTMEVLLLLTMHLAFPVGNLWWLLLFASCIHWSQIKECCSNTFSRVASILQAENKVFFMKLVIYECSNFQAEII